MAETSSTTGKRRQQRTPRRKFVNQTAKERPPRDQVVQQLDCSESESCNSISCSVEDRRMARSRPRPRAPRRGHRQQARRTKSDSGLPPAPKREGDFLPIRRHHSDTRALKKVQSRAKNAQSSSASNGVGSKESSPKSSDIAPRRPLRRHHSDPAASPTTLPVQGASTQLQFCNGEIGSVESIRLDAFVDQEEVSGTRNEGINEREYPGIADEGLETDQTQPRSKWTRSFESPFSVQQPLVSMVLAKFRTEKPSLSDETYGQLQSP